MGQSNFISYFKTDTHYFTHSEWLNDFQEYHGISGSIETGIRNLDEHGEIVSGSFQLIQHGIRDLEFVNEYLPKLILKRDAILAENLLQYLWKRKKRLYRAKVI